MNNLVNILKKEIKEMFRDKKSLSMMLIIPFMIPLLIFGMSFLFESQVNKNVEEYNKIGFSYTLDDVEREIAKEVHIDVVEKDEIIAYVGDVAVKAGIGGMLRGLIRDGYECTKGLKIADIDPRGERAEYRTMSDKARSISGAVLEVVDSFFSCPDKWK